jgi:hypothetical protein
MSNVHVWLRHPVSTNQNALFDKKSGFWKKIRSDLISLLSGFYKGITLVCVAGLI